MKGIDFNHTIDRTESSSMKWEKYRGQDVLPMWVADSDFKVAEEIIDALKARADHGIFGYTLVPDRLKVLVVERMARMYDWQCDASSLVFIPGLVCGLNITARAFGSKEKKVGIPTPIYPPFVSSVQNAGLSACYLPFIEQSGRWMLDWQTLEAQADQINLLMLCNPQNPGGTVFRREELERLATLAEQYDWIVCSDEIHCDLVLDEVPHIPFASLSEQAAARSCTLMAPSKTWNIAGLGCSFAIIENPQLRAKFKRVAQGIVPEVNLMAIEAAIAAYEHGQDWLSAQIQYLRENRDYIEQQVSEIEGLAMLHTEATFLAWIDVSGLGLENPAHYFESYGVGFSPGRDFGNDQFVRLNFGCQRALLDEAFARIRRAIADLPSN